MSPGPTNAPPRGHLSAQQRTFGKYTLIARLAVGGMAEIFLARLEGAGGFRKQVVIKRILPHLAEDQRFVAMFLDEARIAARISHHNVCPVYELGEVDGQLFLAMEYLDGLPLSRIMRTLAKANTTIAPVMGAALIAQACEGLHHAHSLADPDGTAVGVIHRDVSPQNLFLTTAGVLKVLDFGVAKIRGSSARTRTGTLKGKYAYMSPEQLRGEPLDHRSDVFALGVCAFELFTTRRLFARDTDFLVFKAIVEDAIPRVRMVRPDIPGEIDDAVARALSRDRDHRFGSMRELAEALGHAAATLGGLPGPIALGKQMKVLFKGELEENEQFLSSASAMADADLESGDRTIVDVDKDSVSGASALPVPPRSWNEDDDGWSAAMPSTLQVAAVAGTAADTTAGRPKTAGEADTEEDVRSTTGHVKVDLRGKRLRVWGAGVGAAVVVVVVMIALLWPESGSSRSPSTTTSASPSTPTPTVPTPTPTPVPTPTPAPRPLAPRPLAPPPVAKVERKPERKPERRPEKKPERKPEPERKPVGTGTFTIDAKPYATIYVDGKKLGVTPLFKKSLPAGKHTVKAVAGGKTKTFTIEIEPGRDLARRVTW